MGKDELRCPRCNARVGEAPFVYVELVAMEREVLGFDSEGRLRIASEESIAAEDGGTDGHLECACGGRVELGCEVEWE